VLVRLSFGLRGQLDMPFVTERWLYSASAVSGYALGRQRPNSQMQSPLRPNTSLEPTLSGRRRKAATRPVYFRFAALRHLPARAAQLKR
jgi:hypothetical protein